MAVADRVLFFNKNYSDAAVVSSSSENANFPLANLKTEPRRHAFRTTGLANQWMLMDMGGLINLFNSICLINHNATANGTWSLYADTVNTNFPNTPENAPFQLLNQDFFPSTIGAGEGGAGEGGAGGILDPDDLSLLGKIIFQTFAQQELRWWFLTFSDPTNPDGFLEIGRLFLGWAVQPSINMSWGNEFGLIDPSRISETVGGGMITDIRPQYRQKRARFDFISDSEKYFDFYKTMQLIGKSGNMVISFYPDDADTGKLFETIYGKVTNFSAIKQTGIDRNSFELTIRELV